MQTQRVSGVATNTRSEDGYTIIRYHDTDVVKFNDNEVVLQTGGWFTMTTKTRMNQASNQFGLGYTVYQKNHTWYARDKFGWDFEFKGDTLTLDR